MLQKGERVSNFASELDNMVNNNQLESMMIGPLFDTEGILRGAIQFVNKMGEDDQVITQGDLAEIAALLPTLAEVFRTADKVRAIYNTMVSIEHSMIHQHQYIEKDLCLLESNDFIEINTALAGMNREVAGMMAIRKDELLKDEGLISGILAILRVEKDDKLR